MQTRALFGMVWSALFEASVLALGERGTAAFALVMSLFCGLATVYLVAKSAKKVAEFVWTLLGLAISVFVAIALLNAFAPQFYGTLGHLFDVTLGRAALLV